MKIKSDFDLFTACLVLYIKAVKIRVANYFQSLSLDSFAKLLRAGKYFAVKLFNIKFAVHVFNSSMLQNHKLN